MVRVLVAVSRPKIGAAGKTGTWRFRRPVIDYEKCDGCGYCWMFCPEASIVFYEDMEKPKVNYDWCKGCGICADVCPRDAITMKKERIKRRI